MKALIAVVLLVSANIGVHAEEKASNLLDLTPQKKAALVNSLVSQPSQQDLKTLYERRQILFAGGTEVLPTELTEDWTLLDIIHDDNEDNMLYQDYGKIYVEAKTVRLNTEPNDIFYIRWTRRLSHGYSGTLLSLESPLKDEGGHRASKSTVNLSIVKNANILIIKFTEKVPTVKGEDIIITGYAVKSTPNPTALTTGNQ